MSGDEIIATGVGAVLGLLRWLVWYAAVLMPGEMLSPVRLRWALLLGPPLCGAVLLLVLLNFAASDVRTAPEYIVQYFVMGAAWVGMGTLGFSLTGLRAIEDVAQRRNGAAGWAVLGSLMGLTLCYAGGNIGDGPGWWVVMFAAGLATGAWFLVWLGLDLVSDLTTRVSVERDTASGLRLGALLTAAGLILGRGAAGTWVSVDATVADFVVVGWPAALFIALEAVIGFVGRPTPERPRPNSLVFGAFPGAAYLALAVGYVVSLGWLA